jgi:pimeloyl-ACP methyl ester carboxylesterase
MHVVFNHGKESGPEGGKIRVLSAVAAELGHDTVSIDYTDLPDDPEARADRLCTHLASRSEPAYLVGSSMGAYVALAAAERTAVAGLYLMAPAAYLDGFAVQEFAPRAPTTIIHGWADEVIPWENALRLARAVDGALHLIHAEHRLAGVHDLLAALLRDALVSAEP